MAIVWRAPSLPSAAALPAAVTYCLSRALSGLIAGTNITISVTTDGSGNKTLTLTGYDTLANYQQVLQCRRIPLDRR